MIFINHLGMFILFSEPLGSPHPIYEDSPCKFPETRKTLSKGQIIDFWCELHADVLQGRKQTNQINYCNCRCVVLKIQNRTQYFVEEN